MHINIWAEIENSVENNDTYVVSTYPKEWIISYSLNGYAKIDPTFYKCQKSNAIYSPNNDHDLTIEQIFFFEEAHKAGIGSYYISVPVSSNSSRSIVTFSFEKELDYNNVNLIDIRTRSQALLSSLLELKGRLTVANSLSSRETECLNWAAVGKTDDEIAQILGISRWTVVAHFQSIKTKLAVVNRPAAVMRAFELNIIKREQF